MSVVSNIEAMFGALRATVGGFTADTERYITAALASAKTAEDEVQIKIQGEISHLTSLGYTVTSPAPTPPPSTAAVAVDSPQ